MRNHFTRRDFLKVLGVGATTAAAAVALSGCAKSTDDVQTGGETTTQTGTTDTTKFENVDTSVTEDKVEGWTEADATETLTYQTNSAFYGVSPGDSTGGGDTLYNTNYMLFDPLISVDEEGNVIGWLAEEYNIDGEGLKCTFKIRDDVYFTNGDKMTAEDLRFMLERWRSDTERITSANNIRPYLDSIEAPDDTTLIINFAKPMPEFLYQYTLPSLGFISKKAFEASDYELFLKNPVGTGAYVIETIDGPNSIIDFTLRSDEHGYWAYKAFDMYTNVKTWKFRLAPEATTRVSSLRTGDVDVISNIPSTDVATLEQAGAYIYKTTPNNAVYLQFACGEGKILSDKNIREAISLCIDREAIVDALLDGYGHPSFFPCMEGDFGWDQATFDEFGYKYDVERAKELVANSTYNNETLTFIYNPNTVAIGSELTVAIQSMCQAIGLNVEITPLETAIYDEDRKDPSKYDICLGNIAKSVTCWFKPSGHIIGNDQYNTGFQNEEMRNLAIELQSTMDEEKQDDLFKQIYKHLVTDFQPIIHLYWPVILYAWDANITGVRFHHNKNMDLSAVVIN